jgi:hypothetical protein
LIALTVRRGPGGRAQKSRVRKDGWTPARRRRFFETLAATCNVSEAARAAKRGVSTVYAQRARDPGFMRDWEQALSIGYAELETLLLREALFGGEQEEVTLDAEGVVKGRKLKRGRDMGVALRLLLAHRPMAERLKEDAMRDGPEGADAMAALRKAIEAVRKRRE